MNTLYGIITAMTSRTFSEWLNDNLSKRGMSVSELSKLSGVSRATIYNYMTNQASNPSVDVLDRLARALRVSPQEIYWAAQLIQVEPDIDKEMQEMASIFGQLSEDDQRRILEIGKALLSLKSKHLHNKSGEQG